MVLSEIIINKIQNEGPVSFRDFMEMALYHPEQGYYTSEGEKIGPGGDFYTSPYCTSLFGQMIARQIEEMWNAMDQQPFTIVEYGAGTGILCRDILDELQQRNKTMYEKLKYAIIEKSAAMREKERKIVSEKVCWHDDIRDIAPFVGCILSNELVDNFSVHQVVMKDELMEVFVGYDNGFVELLQPASDKLKDYLTQLGVVLPRGFRTEINLEAAQWIGEMAAGLTKGYVLTIDYGYSSANLYNESRSQGSIVCYHKHQVNYCPYDHIGRQDITTHVNFSALCHWGSKNGLELSGFTNQSYFLLGLGLGARAEKENSPGDNGRFLQNFLCDMGSKLKVLIQHKGIAPQALSGLKFSRQRI